MLKILLVALLVGLVSSCAMEDPDASGVLVDPNSDTEVPDWVTAAYLDLNKDGVINILDLVIVSKFMGQEVDVKEEVVAESCPAGQYRKLIPKVVGYHKDWFRRVRRVRNDAPFPTDNSGRRLEEKHEESCAYLYPDRVFKYDGSNYPRGAEVMQGDIKNEPPDRTCLLPCISGGSVLCSQTEKIYSSCEHCSVIKNYGSITYAEYIQSDDPTKCQRGEKNEIQYRFAHGDDFYVYALVYFSIEASFDIASERAGARYRGPRSLPAAIRILVTEDGKRVKEIKVKTLIKDSGKNISRDQLEIREVFNAIYLPNAQSSYDDYANIEEKIVFLPIDAGKEKVALIAETASFSTHGVEAANEIRYNVVTVYPGQTAIRHDWARVKISYLLNKTDKIPNDENAMINAKTLYQGIPIGKPSKNNTDFSDSYIYRVYFLDQHERSAQNPIYYTASYSWIAPYLPPLSFKEVRTRYFPEDIE